MRLRLLLIVLLLPAAAPAAERELAGALVLVGGNGMPASVRDRFVELAGGPAEARLVVVPTASADADDPKQADAFLEQWKDAGLQNVRLLHTRDRARADDEQFCAPLREATAVWFSGGDQKRVVEAYRGTRFEKELKAVMQRGGVVGGTSAGAAIASEVMIESGNQYAKTGPGLGLLPGFVVDQHFLARNRFERLLGAVHRNPGTVGLGIDEATAVVIQKRSVKVLGASSVMVCLAASPRRPANVQVLKQGEEADLFQLRRAARFRQEGAFPPAKPEPPTVESGTLMIGGGGGLSREIMKQFVTAAGGPDAKIVFVATAGDDPIKPEPVEVRILKEAGARNVHVMHTRNPDEANRPEFFKPLQDASGVWFSGGRQWRFVDAYEGTECEKLFRGVLKRGGVIGGSSAGASIQSEFMPRGHPLGNTVMMAEGYERGFGYLKGVAVDQHFFARKRTQDMSELVNTFPQFLGIGIDEGTVIVVKGSQFEVVGRGNVAVYDTQRTPADGKDYQELTPGTKYDMVRRAIVQ